MFITEPSISDIDFSMESKANLKRKASDVNVVEKKNSSIYDNKSFDVLCKIVDKHTDINHNINASKHLVITELFSQTEKMSIAKEKKLIVNVNYPRKKKCE